MKSGKFLSNLILSIALIGLVSSVYAFTFSEVTGHVTTVEATYMPSTITFKIDAGGGSITADQWLTFNGNPDLTKTVYATLLTAIITGQKVRVYGNGTTVTNIHLLKDQ